MKKILFLSLILLLIGGFTIGARDIEDYYGINPSVRLTTRSRGARDIEDFYRMDKFENIPQMFHSYPTDNVNVLIVEAPAEIIQFFLTNGIDPQYLDKNCEVLPAEVCLQMREICSDCQSDFCSALNSSVAHLMETHYDAIVISLGNVYWTVWT